MNYKRLISAAIVLILCLSMLMGCAYNPQTVLTVNGVDVSCGVYLFEQLEAVQLAIETYGDAEVTGSAIYDVEIEGMPARDWINQKTVERCAYIVFINSEFERLGLEVDEMSQYYYEYAASSTWSQNGQGYLRNGISYETFLEMYLNSYKESMVINTLYGADGELAISEADKQAYLESSFTRFDYLKFPTTDSYGYALSSLDQVEEVANKLAAATTDEELKELYLANYSEILTLTGSSDEVSEETFNSAFITDSLLNKTSTSFSAEFIDAVLATETDGAFHLYVSDSEIILYRAQPLTEEDTVETYDSTIVSALAQEPFKAHSQSVIDGYEIVEDARARKYYSLDKVALS